MENRTKGRRENERGERERGRKEVADDELKFKEGQVMIIINK